MSSIGTLSGQLSLNHFIMRHLVSAISIKYSFSPHLSVDEESTDQEKPTASKATLHMAQALFPSMLCTSFVEVIRLLDDHAVSLDGTAVYEVAYQVYT